IRTYIVHELLHLRRSRRQADQVERYTTDQRGAIGLGRWSEASAVEPREDEAIDSVAALGAVPRRRHARTDHGPEGPVLLAGRRVCGRRGGTERGEEDHRPYGRPPHRTD